jgi:hypothetical protein
MHAGRLCAILAFTTAFAASEGMAADVRQGGATSAPAPQPNSSSVSSLNPFDVFARLGASATAQALAAAYQTAQATNTAYQNPYLAPPMSLHPTAPAAPSGGQYVGTSYQDRRTTAPSPAVGPVRVFRRTGDKPLVLFSTPCLQLSRLDRGVGPFATVRDLAARTVLESNKVLPVEIQPVCF